MGKNDGKDLFGLGRAFGSFAPGLMPAKPVSLKAKRKRRKPIAPRAAKGDGPRAKRERM